MKWMQAHESRDCGAACLAMVALYYGTRLDIGKVAMLARTNMQGARLDCLRDAAHALGFSASSGKLKLDQFRNMPVPVILHLTKPSGDHYVVLVDTGPQVATIADPSIGIYKTSINELWEEFSGFVLLLSPNSDFREKTERYRGEAPLYRTLQAVKGSWKNFILAAIAALLVACTSIAVPFVISRMIDDALTASVHFQRVKGTTFALELFIAIGVFNATFSMARQMWTAALSIEIEQSNLSAFVARLAVLPLSFFDRCVPGDLMARVNDAVLLRLAVTGPLLNVILDVAYLAVASCLLLSMNVSLLIITLIAVIITYLVQTALLPKRIIYNRVSRTRMTELVGTVLDTVTGIKLVKSLVQEHEYVRRIHKRHEEVLAALKKITLLSGASTSVGLVINGTAMAVLIILAADLINTQAMSVGKLSYLVAVSSVMIASSERIVMSATSIDEAAVSVERLMQTQSVEPEILKPTVSGHTPSTLECIRLKNLSFAYHGDQMVLHEINFTVNQGEVIGIKGESGSGKSTLALLCNGLYRATSGEVSILGIPIERWDLHSLRKSVSIVFSDSNLITGSIRDNIALGVTTIGEESIANAAKMTYVDDFVRSLPNGYSHRLGHMGLGLSSGQRQRIALARAYLSDAALLILDEATSCLDVEMERRLLQNLLERRRGLTTMLISHRAETLSNAHRIYSVRNGVLTELSISRQECSTV